MTRQEFIDDVNYWWELIAWCNDYDCSVCEDIRDQDEFDEYVDEDLYDRVRNYGWKEVLDWLESVPSDYDYYNVYEWEGVTDYDFDNYKDDALEWGDEHDIWDDPEDEEEEEEAAEEEELEPIQLEILFVDEPFDDIQQAYTPPAPPEPEPTPTEAYATPEFEFKEEPLSPISELYGEITII